MISGKVRIAMEKIANGIWKLSFGKPETITPACLLEPRIRHDFLNELACPAISPIGAENIIFKTTTRGCVVELPLKRTENIYGFGLQLYSLNQLGKKKLIRVNSDPLADTGDSHAPVPFYVSTAGYGVLIDSARYLTFYCGTNPKKGASRATVAKRKEHVEFSENALYAVKQASEDRTVIIEVPAVAGVDLYLFAGPDIKTAVQRYNLFSGGGCLPPLWGLGVWYRAYGGSKEADVYRLAQEFRKSGMPVDVFGLEPGWQSHSYSCSYQWDDQRFPNPGKMLADLSQMDYKVNLWEHLFVHPTAKIYSELMDYSGDYEVWGGLVPDFAISKTREIFGRHHSREFIDQGVSGFKLDECDNSDYNPSNWSFPDCTQFPSGMDGEQMHNLIGLLYQETLLAEYQKRNQRTLGQVRSSGALASSLPFVLYSDLYKHREFIRGVATAGFSGLLWAPEVRDAVSGFDLVRRVQTVVFSPQALLNCWRIPNPPWINVNLEQNLAGEVMPDSEAIQDLCRKFFEVRMGLLPYLYTSFAKYYLEGIPPFRALVMDYPEDPDTHQVDNEYLMGDAMLVAPMVLEDNFSREVYLPEGDWYDFWTNRIYPGRNSYLIESPLDRFPVFIKAGTLLPYAKPVQSVTKDTCFEITVRSYGKDCCEFTLYEDDGFTFDYSKGHFNLVHLRLGSDGSGQIVREGNFEGRRYQITAWQRMETIE